VAKGRPTARSQNYLRQYGYPSARELRAEAQGLASASVPTVRSVTRPYARQLQSSRDFLAAVQAALADTSSQVGQGYDTAIAQSQGVDQAAQSRLSSLGLTPEAAVAQGQGDSATQNLISNAAAAKNYAAQLPGIAAGQAYVGQQGINKNLTDALANRRDALSQAFFQALNQVQGQALQRASFNEQAQVQQQQLGLQYAQLAQQTRESNRQYGLARDQLIAQYGFDPTTGHFIQGSQGAGSTIQGIAKAYGLTPNEVITLQGHTSTQVEQLLAQGVPWRSALARAEANGVPPQLALSSIISIYSNPPAPPSLASVAGNPLPGITDRLRLSTSPAKITSMLTTGGLSAADANKFLSGFDSWRSHMLAYQNALKDFKVTYVWRQLQRAYDSVLHPTSTSTEH